jgi:hypothetical protein
LGENARETRRTAAEGVESASVTRQHPAMRLLERARRALERRLERGRTSRARRLEAFGQLAEATAAYLDAGAPEEAARVIALRVDTTASPLDRAQLLAQAADLVSADDARPLRLRRARMLLDLARDGRVVFARSELCVLGAELESLEEPAAAAQAFELAGDAEGQQRALIQAGAVERLEQVLEAEHVQALGEAERRQAALELENLIQSGRRRQALELAGTQLARAGREDARLEARVRELENRRVRGPRVRLEIDGTASTVVLGEIVTIGRSDAAIVVCAPVLSRTHLEIRRGDGGARVADLGSRNGTLLGGARLSAPVNVGSGLTLSLGGEIPVTIAPWEGGGVRLDVAGEAFVAPLGCLNLGAWSLCCAADGWVEVDIGSTPAALSGSRVTGQVQLLHGDTLAHTSDRKPRVRVA